MGPITALVLEALGRDQNMPVDAIIGDPTVDALVELTVKHTIAELGLTDLS